MALSLAHYNFMVKLNTVYHNISDYRFRQSMAKLTQQDLFFSNMIIITEIITNHLRQCLFAAL